MATARTTMPMPPIQWVKLRQKRSPRGSEVGLGRIDAPVVVKPLIVSKYASMGLRSAMSTYGTGSRCLAT